ncbi:hypothetical protein KJI95_07445 [Shewanella sp. JM162201]|uniref:Uncharacterized protein n=1 Tax=Shewanella jiangmenensis TaxID=2837387 RepID=A0ABS5V1L5_9GAMM|nr:hypothetical protein [Shewanella jiangmenensis]MBT1444359.1 hypothetical protein [Shewanella jiangmenensis]
MEQRLQSKNAFFWLLGVTGLVLTMPFVAMQLGADVHWSGADFVVMAALLLTTGTALILLARKLPPRRFAAAAVLVLLGFVLVWAELAVGLVFGIGS